MTTTTLKIQGMTCDHCVHVVQQVLSLLPGVKGAQVSLSQKQALVESEVPLDLSAAIQALEEEGYQAHVS